MEKILDFFLRIILGILVIILINFFLLKFGITTLVGVNGVTVLTCGILGFPGLAALYAFAFYKLL